MSEIKRPFCSATGSATEEVPCNVMLLTIRLAERAPTAKSAREQATAKIRLLQDLVKKTIPNEFGITLAPGDHRETMPQVSTSTKFDGTKREHVQDGYICNWSTTIRIERTDIVGKLFETVSKVKEKTEGMSFSATFGLTEELARTTNRKLFAAARKDADLHIQDQASVLGYDPKKLALTSYGDPEESYSRSARSMAAPMMMDAAGGSGGGGEESEPLQFNPGTRTVSKQVVFNYDLDEVVRPFTKS